MSSGSYGRILFGGQLKKSLRPALLKALLKHVQLSDGDEEEVFKHDLRACEKIPQSLEYTNEYATYGHFEQFEKFLQKHGLYYKVYSSGDLEVLPEFRSYDPTVGQEFFTATDTEERTICQVDDVHKFLDISIELCANKEKVPLYINGGGPDFRYERVAKKILQTGSFDFTTIFKACLEDRYPTPTHVPPLIFI